MRGKVWFALGAAAGFVLGARAGRERYDELVLNARKLWDHPTVQEAAGVVQAQANRLYHEGKETVTEKLGNTRLGEKLSATNPMSQRETVATSPAGSPAREVPGTANESPAATGTAY